VWYKSNYVLNAVASTSRGLRTADELVIAGWACLRAIPVAKNAWL
jgi:hypothetical protein